MNASHLWWTILTAALSLGGCSRTQLGVVPADQGLAQDAIKEARFGDPMFAQNSDYLMLPYSVKIYRDRLKTSGLEESDFSGAGSLSYVRYHGSVRWNNVAFVHTTTHQAHLLLDRRAIITHFWYPTLKKQSNEVETPAILIVGIAESDTSGDGLIDGNDAIVGYIADLSGRTLTRVTPEATSMMSYQFHPQEPWLYIEVQRDTDSDGKFDSTDESEYLAVDWRHPKPGVPLIDETLRNQAKAIVTQ